MGLPFFLYGVAHCLLHDDLAPCLGRDFLRHGVPVCLVLFRLGNDPRLVDLAEFKAVADPLDFGSVLGTGDNIHRCIAHPCVFVPQQAIQYAVAFCLLGKLLNVLLRQRKDLEFLSRPDHIGEPCLTFGLLFLLQHGHQQQGDILCRRACEFCGDLKAFKRKPDDLFRRITAVVHSCGSPFVLIFLPLHGLRRPFPR